MTICRLTPKKVYPSSSYKFIRKRAVSGFWKVAIESELDEIDNKADSLIEDVTATTVKAEAGQDSSITVNIRQEGHKVRIATIKQPRQSSLKGGRQLMRTEIAQ